MIKKGIIQRIKATLPRVKLNEPMKRYTSLGVGGVASVFAEVKERRELESLLQILKDFDVPYFVIGGGTNLLVDDEGVEGVVIRLGGGFRWVEVKGELLRAGAGTRLGWILRKAVEEELGGLEFVAGIPGTLGGAIRSSASAFGNSIIPLLRRVEYMANTEIILEAELRLHLDHRGHIERRIENFLQIKKSTQPLTLRSAGCVFKNPKGRFAGELIDRAGLKGMSVGGAYVSYKHANFIINRGDATSRDVLTLMDIIKGKVKDAFGVELEPEIHIIGKGIDRQENRGA
jgi:UDP-N-acetylmuramate dehydrogenase